MCDSFHNLFRCVRIHAFHVYSPYIFVYIDMYLKKKFLPMPANGPLVISKTFRWHTYVHTNMYWKEIISFLTDISECLDQFQHHHCTIKKFSMYTQSANVCACVWECDVFLLPLCYFSAFFFDISFHFLVYHHQRCYIIRVVFRQLCGVYFFQTICVWCVCSIHHSTRCLFVLPQTFTNTLTHTERETYSAFIHTFSVSLTSFPLGHATCYAECEIILTLVVSFCLALVIFASTF